MTTQYYISKNRVLPPSQDYEFLKNAGMEYIEKLGNKFWTDYNPHDPGITILEVLSYVITELGYRSDFSINNLLSDKEGNVTNGTFFKANDILANAPLTETDYRKLLIDIDGVSNAWFLSTKKTTDASGFLAPNDAEEAIYINVLDDKLSFLSTNSKGEKLNTLTLRGLNKVVIELEEDADVGDLNATITDYEFLTANENWVQVSIVPPFTDWNNTKTLLLNEFRTASSLKATVVKNPLKEGWIQLGIINDDNGHVLSFSIEVADHDETDLSIAYFKTDFIKVIDLFYYKKLKIDTIFHTVLTTLQANRNFCEDLINIETISAVSIAVCAKIEVMPQANATDVMAQVQIAIDGVISPQIKFYSLLQLVQEGYHTEDIFLGPKLIHGFLKEDELINSELPTSIHASDIIAAIMKIDGVEAVSDVLMTLYDQNGAADADNSNKSWCLHLPGNVNVSFSANRSRLQLYQKNIPFLLSEDSQMIVDQKVHIYKAIQKNYKLNQPDNRYTSPRGTFYQLDDYYSIQDEFPITYYVGKNTLPDTATDKRKAQVKQLQGYLYFYEQILADFFSQLYNAKDLLDINTLKSSYFPRFIEKDDLTGLPFYSAGLLTDDAKKALTVSNNEQITLYETKTTFYDRRNRSLDHLMARFAESFNDYVFMMYQVQQDATGLGDLKKENIELIEDKQNFIANYPAISSARAIAFNYTIPSPASPPATTYSNYWDTSNIGGYARRVSKLLGINEWPIQPWLYNDRKDYWTLNVNNEIYFFRVLNPETGLAGKKEWANENSTNTVYQVLTADVNEEGYAGAQKFVYMVKSNGERVVKIDTPFEDTLSAQQFIVALKNVLNTPYEYFYALENILIRPFPEMDKEEHSSDPSIERDLLPVCLQDDCNDPANNDPYSFKASIVLPGWMDRFSNTTFRAYAEKIFRLEAPAHVLLKICWVDHEDMDAYKEAYNNWYNTYNDFRVSERRGTLTDPVITQHLIHHRELIEAIKRLNTTYPEGHLYDCKSSETNNPIILGNTALGNL